MIDNKNLKEKILDLAIVGKLIKTERDYSKNTEFPFSIPKEWEWKKLQDISSVNGGYSFQSKNYKDNGIRVFRISDFNEDGILNDNIVRHDFNESLNGFILNVGDTVICMTGGTVGKSLYIDFLEEPMVTNQRVATIKPNPNVNSKYIGYVIKSKYVKRLFNENKTSTNDNISLKLINELPIPLPPLNEQNEIVNKIDELFELVDKKEQNDIEKEKLKEVLKTKILDNAIHGNLVERHTELNAKKFVEELKQARDEYIINNKLSKSKDSNTKNEMFDIPEHWYWTTIGDICFVTKLAGFEYTKYVAKNLSSSGEVPVVRAQNIKPNLFVDNCQEFISNDLSEKLYRCALDSKCVLMTFIGAGIGEACVFDKDKRYHLAPNVAKIVPGIDINKYIMYYLMSKEGKKNIFDYKKSTAQASLSMETIRNVVIPIPPFVELKEIVEKIDSLFELIEQL